MSLDDDDVSRLVREHGTRHATPEGLRAGIRAQIALAEAGRGESKPTRHAWPGRWRRFGWGPMAASFSLGMLCMALLLPLAQHLELRGPLDAELVERHVRALQPGPLIEVASTDRHTVKPWFQGRVDFAPPVLDLADAGFALLGGRVEHLRGESLAVLAYTHNRHVLDVFIKPGTQARAPERSVQRGFSVAHWGDGSMAYWVVSDMDPGEVDAFARLWRERSARR